MPLQLKLLQQHLGYAFEDPALAQRALTHKSADRENNERLEFLGDALLGYVIAEALFQRFPAASEGDLSRIRAGLVNKSTLADIARGIDLGFQLELSTGEIKSGGKCRDSILSDAVEALIAAVYLDGGIDACKKLVLRLSAPGINKISLTEEQKDGKTRLQELLQSRKLKLPEYTVVEIAGQAHDQTFTVQCKVDLLAEVQQGSGKTKRVAEQEAAQKVLLLLQELD